MLLCALPAALPGEIVDSVVATVGQQPIKHSDVMRDLRITAFLNQTPLALTPGEKQAAVNRLVDQAIIRGEMADGGYGEVDQARVNQLFVQIQGRYANQSAFRSELASFGLTEAILRSQLSWQLAVLDFTNSRFGIAPEDSATASEDEFLRWLDTARRRQPITIRTERLK